MIKNAWAETVCSAFTIMLLLLFAAVACVFTVAVGNTYSMMSEKQNDSFRLRVASNYITNQLRSVDKAGGISVSASQFGDCLVLSEDIDGEGYETRIYFSGGYLQESFTTADSPYDEQTGFEITELDGFGVSFENGMILVTITSGAEMQTVVLKPMSKGGGLYEAS